MHTHLHYYAHTNSSHSHTHTHTHTHCTLTHTHTHTLTHSHSLTHTAIRCPPSLTRGPAVPTSRGSCNCRWHPQTSPHTHKRNPGTPSREFLHPTSSRSRSLLPDISPALRKSHADSHWTGSHQLLCWKWPSASGCFVAVRGRYGLDHGGGDKSGSTWEEGVWISDPENIPRTCWKGCCQNLANKMVHAHTHPYMFQLHNSSLNASTKLCLPLFFFFQGFDNFLMYCEWHATSVKIIIINKRFGIIFT